MATMPNTYGEPAVYHDYHAVAHALSGHLNLPVNQEIQKQAAVMLNDRRGGHFFQRTEQYSLEGLITFKSGYTHVSGNPSKKATHGWVTLATSVLEGLNVLDVITADRVVAQVSTDHPEIDGHVPHVTFLGTHFENLRIGGYEVKLELDLDICGEKPDSDLTYLQEPSFLERVEWQSKRILQSPELPTDLWSEYDKELNNLAEIKNECNGFDKAKRVKCSLIKSIEPIPVAKIFGNVLEIPGFGLVSLAGVEVGVKPEDPKRHDAKETKTYPSNYFTLTMLSMKMGCIGDGKVNAGTASSNGHNKP